MVPRGITDNYINQCSAICCLGAMTFRSQSAKCSFISIFCNLWCYVRNLQNLVVLCPLHSSSTCVSAFVLPFVSGDKWRPSIKCWTLTLSHGWVPKVSQVYILILAADVQFCLAVVFNAVSTKFFQMTSKVQLSDTVNKKAKDAVTWLIIFDPRTLLEAVSYAWMTKVLSM